MTDEHRLPTSVRPRHYDLRLVPDLDAETFEGTVGIDVDVLSPTADIVLNAAGLEVTEARVVVAGATLDGTVALDADTERLTVTVAEALPAGEARLELVFSGAFDPQLVGFYLSRFTDADGNDAKLATTQFEATHARKAFPCWDEPAAKASFAITLEIERAHTAVSNAAEVARRRLDNGRDEVEFAPTMIMSTYLVAFVVGPLTVTDPVDVDGTPLRVVHVPGKEHLVDFALDAGAFGLRYFADYFDIAYPGDKCDLVAIPDFAFGAMENLGCITFREVLLLIDPTQATPPELQRSADVIFHELAHMWFGDLVTMSWWNGLWLNEAFATFMEMRCTDAYRPEWFRWVDFGLSRTAAFDTDSLGSTRPIEFTVHSPQDAEAMFDILTYEKGASVVRMLEQYLGEDRFREGIRAYMAANAYGNADTTDLWDALEQSTGEPVREMMDGWIFQGGFPLLTAESTDDGLRLTQEPMGYEGGDAGDPDRTWMVPVTWRPVEETIPADHDPATVPVERAVLGDEPLTVAGGGAGAVVNAGGHGFYRVAYGADALGDLAGVAGDGLLPVERYALVDDAWASVLAGRVSAISFLNLLEAMSAETDTSVAQRILAGWRSLDRWSEGDARDELRTLVHDALAPTLASIGLEPVEGDDDRRRQLRGDLLVGLAVLAADGDLQRHGADLWAAADGDRSAVDSALSAAAVSIVASTGDRADFDQFVERWRAASTPQEETRFLYALADFDQPDTAAEVRRLVREGEVRSQNAGLLLNRLIAQRVTGRETFAWIRSEWDYLTDYVPTSMVVRMIGSLSTLDRPDDAETAQAFFADHPIPQAGKTLEQVLERQRVAVAAREREADALAGFLTA